MYWTVARTFALTSLSATALLLACNSGDARETSTATNVSSAGSIATMNAGTTEPGTTDDTPTGGVTSSGATEAMTTTPPTTDNSGPGTTTDAIKFDVGEDTGDTTGATEKGCKKVDFLFVIDNSASMEDNQAALIASFPGFITEIQTTLSASNDYHIMVVDSDDDGRCKQPCDKASNNYKNFCANVMPNACEVPLTACDTTRGAGVVHPVGLYATNATCPIAGGNRYMLPEEPDLQKTFACVAQVGTAGNPSERPMNGMTEALSPALNGPMGCNAGFLRDDAILVITFISDDPNYEDEGTPQSWYDAVLASKNGNKEAIVVAGLIPIAEQGCPAGDGDIKAAHWAEFIAMWGERGIAGPICDADYAPFFAQAVGIIDAACDNFIPG